MAASASVAAPTVYDALLEDSGGEDDHRARSRSPKSVIEKVHGVSNLSNVGVHALVSKDVNPVGSPIVHPLALEPRNPSGQDLRWNQMLALVAEQNVGISRAVEIAAVAAAAAAEAVRCLQNLSVSRVPDQTLALPIASVPLAPFRSSSPATTVADRPTVDSTISMSGGKVIPDRIIHGISKATAAFEKDINKFVNADEKLKHELEDITFMKQPGNRYPPGVRPFFKTPVEQITLDSNSTSAANSDQVWSVELPQGISRRGALHIIHHAVAVF